MSDQTSPRAGRRATDPPPSGAAQPRGAKAPSHGAGAFEAQLLTQGTVKRGLRGGQEVLDAARTSYLKAEWSGPADRRPRKGIVARTKI